MQLYKLLCQAKVNRIPGYQISLKLGSLTKDCHFQPPVPTLECNINLLLTKREVHNQLLLTEQVCIGETWPRLYRPHCLYTQLRSRFSYTDQLCMINKMFVMWQTRKFNQFKVTGLCQSDDMLLVNGDGLILNLIRLFVASITY